MKTSRLITQEWIKEMERTASSCVSLGRTTIAVDIKHFKSLLSQYKATKDKLGWYERFHKQLGERNAVR